MAKAGHGGYDGKGTRVIKDRLALSDLIDGVVAKDWLLRPGCPTTVNSLWW